MNLIKKTGFGIAGTVVSIVSMSRNEITYTIKVIMEDGKQANTHALYDGDYMFNIQVGDYVEAYFNDRYTIVNNHVVPMVSSIYKAEPKQEETKEESNGK